MTALDYVMVMNKQLWRSYCCSLVCEAV